MKLNVLGSVTATDDDAEIRLGGPKQRAVLAVLIAAVGEQVPTERIVEAVWGQDTISNARRNVQTYVSLLRSIVGDVIVRGSNGWTLQLEPSNIDALAFERAYRAAEPLVQSNPERASVALREALAMWRGSPYADVEAHGLLDAEITRLEELRLAVQAARIEADLVVGRDADLVGEIEVLIAQHPYAERFRAQHMLALYRAGRQQEALHSYRDLRLTLLDELGVEPTPELQALELRILEQDPELQARPVRSVTTRAVVVVDAGDPIEIAHLPSAERGKLLDGLSALVRDAVGSNSAVKVDTAGSTYFLTLESPDGAARLAEKLARHPTPTPRLAIDWGDVVFDDGQIAGPPISRAAVLASVGHPGQILMSAEAQRVIGADPRAGRLQFEAAGTHRLHGIDSEMTVYQLVLEGQSPFPDLETTRLPLPLPGGPGRSVPGYELRQPFGPGSIGTFHTAFQPSVGREVLVEVIGEDYACDATFVRRFEADAQRLALIDHRHLATVLDYWRKSDGAYLVYPYPRGGTLSGWPSVSADRILRDVGSALAYAHSLSMVHGSIRPDRILLDEAGNASLVAFPLAGQSAWMSAGHPAYIAPESLNGQPASVATDIFAFAVLAYELRHGPLDPEELPQPEGHALATALQPDPTLRQTSVAELLQQLEPRAMRSSSPVRTEIRNPYKGLAAFQEVDADDFFGRTSVVDEIVGRLADSTFVAVIGPSGIGKSSVVRAGLLPALRRGGIPGSDDWIITHMMPGARPFHELRRAVERVAVEPPIIVTDRLATHDPEALDDIEQIVPDGSPLVLVIDQFEELFTMAGDGERERFLQLLLAADRGGQVRVVITLRADFLDQPLGYADFGELLRHSLVAVRAPSASELSEAISGPAKRVGVDLDQEVVQKIVADVHDQAGALPLLQHALVELFDARTSDRIDGANLETVGGIEESLARRAEQIYNSLDEKEQNETRQLFLRLVSIFDDGRLSRRRVRLADLDHLAADHAIDALTNARMLVHDNDPETRSPTIEVAHEALLTEWPRLAAWLDESLDELTLARRLDDLATEWEANDRDPGYLLSGGRLAQHQDRALDPGILLTDRNREYIDTSIRTEAEEHSRTQQRRNVVLTVVGGLAVVAALFGLFAIRNSQRADDEAQRARAEALAAQSADSLQSDPELAVLLATEALRLNPESPSAAVALNGALQLHRTVLRVGDSELIGGSVSPDGSLIAYSTEEELQVLQIGSPNEVTWTWRPPRDHFIAETYFSSDSQAVVAGLGAVNGPCAWDRWIVLSAVDGVVVADRSFPGLIPYSGGPAQTGPYVDLGRPMILGEGGADDCRSNPTEGRVVAVELLTGQQDELMIAATRNSFFRGIPSLSESGETLAVGADDQSKIINLDDGRELALPAGLTTLNAEGSLVLVGNNPVELWSITDERKLREFKADLETAWFSPTERMIYGTTPDSRIMVFDIDTADILFELRGHQGNIRALQMTSDEERIVSFADDGVRVWDVGSPLLSTARQIDFSSNIDGRPAMFQMTHVVAADQYVLAKRGVCADPDCDLTQEVPLDLLYDQTTVYDRETGLDVSSYDGSLLAVAPDETVVALQQTGAPLTLSAGDLSGDTVEGEVVAYGPVVIADLVTGKALTELEGLCLWYTQGQLNSEDAIKTDECVGYPTSWRDHVLFATFSPDGSLLAMAGNTGRYAVWDVRSGEAIWTRDTESGEDLDLLKLHSNVAFSPDGRFLLIAQGRDIQVLEIDSFDSVAEFETEGGAPTAMEFTADGSLLVINDARLNVHVVETETWDRVHTLTGQQGGWFPDIAVDPSGRFVATAGLDNESRVWDLESGEEVQRFIATSLSQGLRNVDWVDDTTVLLGNRQSIVMMTMDPEVLLATAYQRITRSFTDEECVTYRIDPCPTRDEIGG